MMNKGKVNSDMEKWDEFAIITFITCDAILENIYEIKYFYKYFLKKLNLMLKI